MEKKTFVKNIQLILTTGKKQEQLIQDCALYALQTVNLGKTVGADSPITVLWNAVQSLKSVNRQAFMDWLNEYGFVAFSKLEAGGYVIKYKDKSATKNAQECLVAAAQNPWFDFAKAPQPNMKPYDVMEGLRGILTQAKSAATGGAKGDKPIRKIEHQEILDAISYILQSPESSLEKLGLTKPSQVVSSEKQAVDAEVIEPQRQQLKAA